MFAAILAALFLCFYSDFVTRTVTWPYIHGLARVSGAVCSLLANDVRVEGPAILVPQGPAVDLRKGCDGLPAVIVFAAATLAYPCPWGVKAAGLLSGFLVIQLLNVLRVVSLFWIRLVRPELFDEAHVLVWQCVIVLLVLVTWSVWESRWAAPAANARPRPR